jgi:hypothetical protein
MPMEQPFQQTAQQGDFFQGRDIGQCGFNLPEQAQDHTVLSHQTFDDRHDPAKT